MTSPANGAVLVTPAIASLTATATVSNATITSVRFYEGGNLIGEPDTTPPYEVITPPLSLGNHIFHAEATSSTNTTSTSQNIIITVGAPNSPVAVITAPSQSMFIGTFEQIHFAAGAAHTGGGGITRVEFWLDNKLVAQDHAAPYEVDWQVGTAYGSHTLFARAYDENDAMGQSSSYDFEVLQPPTVSIASPAASDAIHPAYLQTIAATAIRGTYPLTEVRFFVNDTLLGIDNTPPYSMEWTPPATGAYKLTARVYDERFFDPWSEPVTVTSTFTPQQAWRQAHFSIFTNTGNAADNADPDYDGLTNIIEWPLSRDPNHAEQTPLPAITVHPTEATFTFSRVDASEPELSLILSWSPDLHTWHDLPLPAASTIPDVHDVTIAVTENGSSPDSITVTIPRISGTTSGPFVKLTASPP
jgi:hypothetical protein